MSLLSQIRIRILSVITLATFWIYIQMGQDYEDSVFYFKYYFAEIVPKRKNYIFLWRYM